ncbi:hypothetical protein [Actinocatenispora rupis]|uniref:Actin-binding WH2 domain-containing protein n=1 Tax=Actinocatenispora rupis TaxID=519421 RepID=A0A8J3NB21_9ACTN|nr:hypothetical protein [Actinocatenispora rupis]GID12919.1 hypothetical protein Aru02nite_38080 [Actinocatenispora rupis]
MTPGNGLLVIERILRDRAGIWQQIVEERDLRRLSGQMLASSAIALAAYGAVLGASSGWQQAVSSAVKLPLLFLITLVICLPTLYLFNLVFGSRLSIRQAVALVSTAVTVLSMLSVAFAPISLFFLITAPNYAFYKLLNVGILVLTAIVGLRFLVAGMRAMNIAANPLPEPAPQPTPQPVPVPQPEPVAVGAGAAHPAAQQPHPNGTVPVPMPHPAGARPVPQQKSASMGLLYVWIVVFGFVGTQLAWTLRPFVGSPGEGFALFRHIEGNFYVDIVRTLTHL